MPDPAHIRGLIAEVFGEINVSTSIGEERPDPDPITEWSACPECTQGQVGRFRCVRCRGQGRITVPIARKA